MSKRTYTFADGKILRAGEIVGEYDEDSRQIKSLDEKLPPNVRGIVENMLKGESEFSSDQPPPQDPKLGDKTPAYIEWMWRTNPKEAEKRYSGRKVSLDAPASVPGDIPEKDMPEEKSEEWH